LSVGDTLVLYTDGVTEAGGGDGGLGEDGLADVVRAAQGLPPSAVLSRIEEAVAERGTLRDDVALLAARVR
jgi:serine phosphatase RsbU (regulator of sigma subunit)